MAKKTVAVGGVVLGTGTPAVQSMTKVKTSDAESCVAQIHRLEGAGCDIIRVSVLDEEDARAIAQIKDKIHIPLVADIHFSASLAVLAAEHGADKLRVNPGNLGGEKEVKLVADCVRAHKIPVRVGANTGSIEKVLYEKYGRSERALVESALMQAALFEKYGVSDIVLSVKASDVPLTVRAYREAARRSDHPLHIGVTEAGFGDSGLVKGAAGIGALLVDGIGDTVRVSLSDDPVKEVEAAHAILRACGLEQDFVEVISCPTCGRCEYDCAGLARRVSERVKEAKKPLKVAVMGCVVNGPGEARECDLGIAGGRDFCVIFQKGEENERVRTEDAEGAFFARLEKILQ